MKKNFQMIMENLSLEDKGVVLLKDIVELDGLPEDLICEESRNLLSEFTCVICTNIVVNPEVCKTCQNLFCKKCINEAIKVNRKCPYKCSYYTPVEIPKSTKNILNKLNLKCPNSNIGCPETILYENISNHLKNCTFLKYKCEFCDFNGTLSKCKEHSKNCQFSLITCLKCEDKIKKNETHEKDNCISNLVKTIAILKHEIKQLKTQNDNLSKEKEKTIENHKKEVETLQKKLNPLKYFPQAEFVQKNNYLVISENAIINFNLNEQILKDENLKLKYIDIQYSFMALRDYHEYGSFRSEDLVLYNINLQNLSLFTLENKGVITDFEFIKKYNLLLILNERKHLIFFDANQGSIIKKFENLEKDDIYKV